MVSEPTVLIVGAGGSMPYGYPSGTQLVNGILKFTQDLHTAHANDASYGGYHGYSLQDVMSFRNSLKVSRRNSIDAFLGAPKHKHLVRLGKMLIAEELVRYEMPSLDLFFDRSDVADDWYRYLSNRLADNFAAGKQEPLTILTYNYDRSLDFYLTSTFQAAFSLSEDEAAEKLKLLKIIHLHGQLSKLPVPVEPGTQITQEYLTEFRHYGYSEIPDLVPKLAEGIRIVHENGVEHGIVRDAEQALSEASRVCFLGFGYNELNLIPLCRRNWCQSKQMIVGSRCGLVDSEIEAARQYLTSRFRWSDLQEKCEQTLRRFSVILS